MRKSTLYCFIAVLNSLYATAFGQTYRGLVLDTKNKPIEFATVLLLQADKPAETAITDSSGGFILSTETGDYRVRIQNIAYKTIETDIKLTAEELDLGVFNMEDAFVNMEEVVVTASHITREADRFVMQINKEMPTLMNKDASEVLQLAPGVWVDEKGISINGAAGAKVYINDRELKLSGSDLVGYLRNYRSADIARVEVVPQAGAEYSADSKGGIIKIILRKQAENGVSGTLLAQTIQGKNYAYYKPSAMIHAMVGKWTWSALVTGNSTPEGENEMTEWRFYPQGSDNFFKSSTSTNNKPRSILAGLGSVYEINNRNSVGAEVEWQNRTKEMPSFSETIGQENGVKLRSTSNYEQEEKEGNLTATFNYIYKVDTLGSTLKTMLDYTDKKVTGRNKYTSAFEIPGGKQDSVYRNRASSNYRLYTTNLMLDKRMKSGIKYAVGLRYARNEMSNEMNYEGWTDSRWQALHKFNYALNYTENISAAYATLSFKLGKLDVLAGLRGEYTHTTGKEALDKKYTDLFPNLNLTYSFNAMKTFLLVAQYARNIERPNFWYLNSNRVQYSDYSYYIGNPLLRPTYINRFSLTAVYRYRHTLTIGGNLHKDLIREITQIDPENPEVKYVTPENHFKENHYFVAISSPHNITKWLSLNTNVVGVKQDIQTSKANRTKSHYLYFINSTVNFSLPAGIFLELTYSGTSKLYSANSGIEPTHLFHAGIKKKLLNNRMNLTLGVHNLFDRATIYFANMEHYTSRSKDINARNARTVRLSLQYTFNSGKSIKKRSVESPLNTEKERIKRASGVK